MIESLLREPYRYEFFQAVRLLERYYRDLAEASPEAERHPIGQDYPPHREVVRLRALPSLSFPPQMLDSLRESKEIDPHGDEPPLELTIAFLGLFGPNGVLPNHYTTTVLSRIREKDYALRDFLDLFNHRTASFFYRAWEKYRFPFAYERAHNEGDVDDLFSYCLYSLVGLGAEAERDRSGVDDEAFLYFAGNFSHHPPTAATLERMLGEYFALPVVVQQFCGAWLRLSKEEFSRLAARSPRSECFNRLGENAMLGERTWDVQGKFRIVVGPIDAEQFRRFMPSGDAIRPLVEMSRRYVGIEFDFDVMLVLPPSAVPRCGLGVEQPDAPRLGWNIWVRSREFEEPVRDAVYYLPTI
ncbi:MAG: type VI secretion system baseplate subunit TssG [Pirellulaceae bacterium]